MLLLIAVIAFAIAIIFGIRVLFASAEQYTFNMTQDLEHEQRVLDICIFTDIYLPYCDTRYGGNGYGEKIN